MSEDEFRELIACSINVEQTRVVQTFYCDRVGAIFDDRRKFVTILFASFV